MPEVPKISKWPFLAGDGLLLCAAFFIYRQSNLPMGVTELSLAVGCIGLGAVLGIIPFVLEYQATVRICETGALSSVVGQVREMNKVAEQISGATARWQNAQDAADKTANAAKVISEQMAAEVKGFTEFMQRVNDGEKNTLRLEVEKLRKAEQDWLHVLVRMLDHVYALHAGAVRSGQPNLIDQLSHFQNACRDAARRVGLVPFSASPAEPFNPERHQVFDGDGKPAADGVIADMIATGYTFQGRMLRPVLVRLTTGGGASEQAATGPIGPTQLPLSGS
jgi:molecular chaperone GrpE (heat shock protein)